MCRAWPHGRWYPTATVLGDVITLSGLNETGGTNTTVEIYTRGTGWTKQYVASWTPPLYPRMQLLPNGKVFYSFIPGRALCRESSIPQPPTFDKYRLDHSVGISEPVIRIRSVVAYTQFFKRKRRSLT